jgi:hypothetical protein
MEFHLRLGDFLAIIRLVPEMHQQAGVGTICSASERRELAVEKTA